MFNRRIRKSTVMASLLEENYQRPFTICVEGNIGSGKSNFLNQFKVFDNVTVLQEPVEQWRNASGTNLLELMYSNPARWSYLFRSYVQLTMMRLHMANTDKPLKIMERSLYSANCFVECTKRYNTMQMFEYVLLDKWYDWCITNADVAVDLIVYLRTTPEVVYERIQSRGRKEERSISLEYLKQLHEVHEEWLHDGALFAVPAKVITIDGNQDLEKMMVEFQNISKTIFEKYAERQTKKINRLPKPFVDTTSRESK